MGLLPQLLLLLLPMLLDLLMLLALLMLLPQLMLLELPMPQPQLMLLELPMPQPQLMLLPQPMLLPLLMLLPQPTLATLCLLTRRSQTQVFNNLMIITTKEFTMKAQRTCFLVSQTEQTSTCPVYGEFTLYTVLQLFCEATQG